MTEHDEMEIGMRMETSKGVEYGAEDEDSKMSTSAWDPF
jgi:hypothetical protein